MATNDSSVSLWKENLKLKAAGFLKIPMIFYVGAKIVHLDQTTMKVKIPFKRRTKNHLNCMYFGAICVGADVAGGFLAMHHISGRKERVQLLFKSMDVKFLKRIEGDALFVCDDGVLIQDMVEQAAKSKERVTKALTVNVLVPSKLGDEPAAVCKVELSLKVK